jgi:hypothetical protein
MLDLSQIAGFEWDDGNRGKNRKHDVKDQEAEQVFFGTPLVVLEDAAHSGLERRFHALGQAADGRRLHVTFTLRGQDSRIRVISARAMHRRERRIYEAKVEEGP